MRAGAGEGPGRGGCSSLGWQYAFCLGPVLRGVPRCLRQAFICNNSARMTVVKGAGIGRIFISHGTSIANHRLIHHFIVPNIGETWEKITDCVFPRLPRRLEDWLATGQSGDS